jgi:hypothetical protein
MNAEGWYEDPFGLHEARWFSDGRPTALVRDGRSASQDRPPRVVYDGILTPAGTDEAPGADDLRRADADEGPFDPRRGSRAAWDAFDQLPKS